MKKIFQKYNLTDRDIDRIVEMAWEDRTPFDAIEEQFGLKEAEVIRLMKYEMKLKNWKKWRARVQGRKTKHRKLRGQEVGRFKSTRQKAISGNRMPKR
ncbi:MAG: TIGR03643 family protein [Bacteroidota bacterium]